MKRGMLAALAGSLVIVSLIGGSILAQGTREPDRAIPHGFQHNYVVVETRERAFFVLEAPTLRMLANRTYLVGAQPDKSPILEIHDPFRATIQWISLDDVRRMGEVGSKEEAQKAMQIELDRRNAEKAEAADRAKARY